MFYIGVQTEMKNRKVYMVELSDAGEPICLFETMSCNQACKFLMTVNRDLVDVRFLRHNPYFEFDVDNILEVLNNAEV